MNAKTKFRAWDVKTQKMIYMFSEWFNKELNGKTIVEENIIFPHFIDSEIRNCSYIIVKYHRNDNTDYIEVKNIELRRGIAQQYTGLKDRNGKEIYEGDVVENYEIKDIVIFKIGMFTIKDIGSEVGLFYPLKSYHDLELIGNIYEHPELLNGEIK